MFSTFQDHSIKPVIENSETTSAPEVHEDNLPGRALICVSIYINNSYFSTPVLFYLLPLIGG